MKDRVSQNPGRVKITPENGSAAYFAKLEMADGPTDPGTPLTRQTLLSEDAAQQLGLDPETATPSEAFGRIALGLSNTYTATLAANGWSGSAWEGYTQTANCPGITDQTVTLPPFYRSSGYRETDIAAREALGMIGRVESLDGQIRVTCWEDRPGMDLTIALMEVK